MKTRPVPAALKASAKAATDPPPGVDPGLWAYCLLGRRVAARMDRDKVGLKAAAAAQGAADRVYRNKGMAFCAQAFNVATRLTGSDWARIGKARTREGNVLTRTHLQLLARADDRELIEALLEGQEREGWTSQELRDRARLLKGFLPDRRGGRPRRGPRSLEDGLAKVIRDAEGWLAGHGPDAPGRAAWLGHPAEGGDAEALLDRLVEVKALLRKVSRTARELEGRLGGVEERARKASGAEPSKGG